MRKYGMQKTFSPIMLQTINHIGMSINSWPQLGEARDSVVHIRTTLTFYFVFNVIRMNNIHTCNTLLVMICICTHCHHFISYIVLYDNPSIAVTTRLSLTRDEYSFSTFSRGNFQFLFASIDLFTYIEECKCRRHQSLETSYGSFCNQFYFLSYCQYHPIFGWNYRNRHILSTIDHLSLMTHA